jgi:hypothetical protein
LTRFQEEFVERRRSELQYFLQKVVAHKVLQCDESLRYFLESENLAMQKKAKTVEPILGTELLPMITQSFPSVGDNNPKILQLRSELVDMEAQLKQMEKIFNSLMLVRKEHADAIAEFGDCLAELGQSESITPIAAKKLTSIARIQHSLKPILERFRESDSLDLQTKISEYIRTIGSIKVQFAIRQKCLLALQETESVLVRKQKQLEKLKQTQIRSDKIQECQFDVSQVLNSHQV